MTPYQRHVTKWRDCDLCPLAATRKRVVLVRGSIPCDVLFVGEAPGPSEDVLGKPFVGPAGKLLDEIVIRARNVNHEPEPYFPELRFAFTNLVGCIPLDEHRDKFAEPSEESIVACLPKLGEIARIADPKIVVAVGKLAAKWLRGKRSPIDAFKVVEIVHPAAILRANEAARGLMAQKAVITLSDAFENIGR